MKKPFFFFLILLIILSLACSLPTRNVSDEIVEPSTEALALSTQMETVVPKETAYSPPTARPTSNETSTPSEVLDETVEPTQEATEPIAACPQYGMEEFDSPTDCWPDTLDEAVSPASISDRNKVSVQVMNSRLEFLSRLTEDVNLYAFYEDNEYDEVIVRASVSKIDPSANQNGFTLVCHVNPDGWYEARVESSGLFEVFQYDALKKQSGANPFIRLGSGGVSIFKTGEGRENIIEWQCGYDYLRLIINGQQIWEKVAFSSLQSGGAVGIGLASYSGALPRHIGFDFVEILAP
jgi:hypothetical protein